MYNAVKAGASEFLLTRPLRDVTIALCPRDSIVPISTHTPLAGRDQVVRAVREFFCISTHTPLAGRDVVYLTGLANEIYFYSHAPCGT